MLGFSAQYPFVLFLIKNIHILQSVTIRQNFSFRSFVNSMNGISNISFQNSSIVKQYGKTDDDRLIVGVKDIDSDNYIKVINPETRQFFIDIHKFDINQFDNDTFISYLIERIDSLSESYFIRDLCKDYIRRAHQKKNYRALILFETIFGYQFLTRKQIDRIRYITFSDGEIYDVMNGYMIPGHVICLLKQKYIHSIPTNDDGKIASRYGGKSVISKVIDDELIPRTSGTVETVNYVKILNSIVFKKIRNMLLSFGRGLSQKEIYDICRSFVYILNPSLKHLVSDYYSVLKGRDLFKDEI